MAGAVIAGLYAAVVVLGGLFSLLRGEPWLLPVWSAVFPIAAAGLSFAGLMRVRRSDGTLGGGMLARWGLLLSVLAGAGYWAYAGTLLFALAREGEQFGGDFLKRLSAADTPGAFRYTVPPADRPADGPGLHDALEARFNAVTRKVPRGSLTAFEEMDYVRILGRLGSETKFEPLGVEEWEYAHGGYRLRLLYQGEARAVLPGASDRRGERGQGVGGPNLARCYGKNRAEKWPFPGGGRRVGADGRRRPEVARLRRKGIRAATPRGERRGGVPLHAAAGGAAAGGELGGARRLGLFLEAGLGTGAVPWAAPAAALAVETLAADEYLARAASLPGLDEFLGGGLVRAEAGTYRAPADVRDETIGWVRQAFRRGNGSLADGLIADDRVNVPLLRREGDRYVIEHDFAMRIPSKPPRLLIEGRVVVEGDIVEADRGSMRACAYAIFIWFPARRSRTHSRPPSRRRDVRLGTRLAESRGRHGRRARGSRAHLPDTRAACPTGF